jgi:drug/metabolite transporter (DMT)-like permease
MTGEILAFISALCFALGSIAIVNSSRKNDNGLLLSVVLTGGFALSAWAFLGRPFFSADIQEHFWPAIAWFAAAGIFSTVWGRTTLYRSVQLAGVVRATTIRRLTPFFSALFAWLVLAESLSVPAMLGMAALGASFVMLYFDNRKLSADSISKEDLSRGCMLALLCAMTYAVSYVVRRSGLSLMPDPYLGAFAGSLAALVYYLVGMTGLVGMVGRAGGERRRFSFRSLDRPQLAAASLISLGQVIQFVALSHTTVARVAVVNSIEIFLSTYLAVFIFKTEKFPSMLAVLATALATVGLVVVAAG